MTSKLALLGLQRGHRRRRRRGCTRGRPRSGRGPWRRPPPASSSTIRMRIEPRPPESPAYAGTCSAASGRSRGGSTEADQPLTTATPRRLPEAAPPARCPGRCARTAGCSAVRLAVTRCTAARSSSTVVTGLRSALWMTMPGSNAMRAAAEPASTPRITRPLTLRINAVRLTQRRAHRRDTQPLDRDAGGGRPSRSCRSAGRSSGC